MCEHMVSLNESWIYLGWEINSKHALRVTSIHRLINFLFQIFVISFSKIEPVLEIEYETFPLIMKQISIFTNVGKSRGWW